MYVECYILHFAIRSVVFYLDKNIYPSRLGKNSFDCLFILIRKIKQTSVINRLDNSVFFFFKKLNTNSQLSSRFLLLVRF